MAKYDAVIVGSGPNGLAAAVTLARAGRSVVVYEASDHLGGGARSEALTLPGFVHDVFSAVHPMAACSKFFSELPLSGHGLEWITPPAQAAHPLDDGEAVTLELSVQETAARLGRDGPRYRSALLPFVERWKELFDEILQPFVHLPRSPLLLARFGSKALLPAEAYVKLHFREERARALFMGIAAHGNASLARPGTAAIGLMLNVAGHARGWPFPRGGAQKVTDALVSYFRSLGGEVETGREVRSLRDLPRSRWVFFDLTPRQLARILGDPGFLPRYPYGPAVFKMDWALSAPIPWTARDCSRSATVHLGGSSTAIAASERLPERGVAPDEPYVLLSQPSLFDPSRAPEGKHTAWAYCHVPFGSGVDMSGAVERQIERFAPGFRDLILARSALGPRDLEALNANLVGGSISGGAISLRQLLFRPRLGLSPYRLAREGHFICSSSTPPGPGVHGLCGMNAALAALG